MGRGRQKAKHMKVARKLKYFSPETDLDALQRELTTSGEPELAVEDPEDEEEDDDWDDSKWSTPSSTHDAWADYKD